MFIRNISRIAVFHTHVVDRTIGMLVMYAGHQILSGMKIQVSSDVLLSLGDQFLVSSLMGSSSPSRPAERTWPGWECSIQAKFKKQEGQGGGLPKMGI
jgi:hypothetical protein